MRRCRTVIVVALLGGAPAIAVLLVMHLVLPVGQGRAATPAQAVEEGAEQVLVLAAAQFLPVGTLLADGHLAEIGIGEELVRPWHIETGDLDALPFGYAVREPIAAGAPVTRSYLVGPWQKGFLATALRPGMRAVAVSFGAGARHVGTVHPGDRVDVVLAPHSHEHGERSALARTILQDVRVLAVERRLGSAAGAFEPGGEVEGEEVLTAMLEVLPSQMGLLALGELEGELSLSVRALAAAGAQVVALDAADGQGTTALPQESGQQTVRVVRGNAVSDMAFGAAAPSGSRPEGIFVQNEPEGRLEIEALRTRAAEQPDPDGIRGEPSGSAAARAGEGSPGKTAGLVSTVPEDTPAESQRPFASRAERRHATATADPGAVLVQRLAGNIAVAVAAASGAAMENPAGLAAASLPGAGVADDELATGLGLDPVPEIGSTLPELGSNLARRLAGGVALPGAVGSTGTGETAVDHVAASVAEAMPTETAPAAAPDLASSRPLDSTQPGLGIVPEEPVGAATADRSAAAPASTMPLASSSATERKVAEHDGPAASSIEQQPAQSATQSDPALVPAPLLAGSNALAGEANSAIPAEDPVESASASLPEAGTVENDLAAGSALEPVTVPGVTQPGLDVASTERAGAGAAPAGQAGPETAEASAFLSPFEGARDEAAQSPALNVDRPDTLPATAPGSGVANLRELSGAAPLAGEAAPAGPSEEAIGLAADLLGQDAPAEGRVAAGPALELLGARPAGQPRRESVNEAPVPQAETPAERVGPTEAEQAVEAAVASLPWDLLSENRMLVLGGPILLLGLSGAFLWLRRQDRALRLRLQSVGAPLTGHGAVEKIAPEESIFRQTRPNTRLSWLWRRIERRYPLIDAPRTFPRLAGVGVVAAVLVWIGMWVLGMSGWWSMPAALLAGFFGAWFFLKQVQARTEKQFIEQFPEIVDQIVRLSGAGLPPLEALGKVAEDARQPVKGVLEEVADALLAGLDADTAFNMVAGRVRLAEFTLFAAVIRLQRRAGGSISESFSNLAKTLRERRTTALKAKASTAQTRLTMLVFLLMPPLVLGAQSMTSPESVDLLFDSENGQTLLQLGVGLIVVGLIVARQIAARAPK